MSLKFIFKQQKLKYTRWFFSIPINTFPAADLFDLILEVEMYDPGWIIQRPASSTRLSSSVHNESMDEIRANVPLIYKNLIGPSQLHRAAGGVLRNLFDLLFGYVVQMTSGGAAGK